LAEIGPKVPSSSSKDHGEPFAKLFARYNHDFYAVDPHLFSPAEVVFQNIETGRSHAFGRLEPAVLGASFLGTA
jgi:methenyltetrahydromethanopterin cyclohydrolase